MTTPPPFELDLSQPEPIPEPAIEAAVDLMRSGRLFRYDAVDPDASGAAAELESRFAERVGRRHAVAVNSCGAALFLALRVCGVQPGDGVLVNAWTLAPVPGAIDHAGARPVLVEVDERLCVDVDDLRAKAAASGARVLLLSHMRGHIADLTAVRAVCDELGLLLVEDCAHALGATWAGRPVGGFGDVACFSLQTFKHLNAGEGGVLLTDDDERAARAILHSGSYMHYGQHRARPDLTAFEPLRGQVANYSLRLSDLAATLVLPQLDALDERCARMNRSHDDLAGRLAAVPGVELLPRPPEEGYVGSSLQFRLPGLGPESIAQFVRAAADLGLQLSWYGASAMRGFTSRPGQWAHVADRDTVPATEELLATLCELRIPPALTAEHCAHAEAILRHALATASPHTTVLSE